MANVQDVAKFFIDLAQKQEQQQSGDLVTNLRLQKLLYFAQGWCLARYDKPLFDAPIEAWKFGPVVREVYNKYNVNLANGISSDARIASDALTAEEMELLLDVVRAYDGYSTKTLVDISHAPDGPWAKRGRSEEISTDEIKKYFKAQPPLPSFSDLLAKQEVVIPDRDANGNAVLPADFDEDWGEYDAD